MKPRTSATFRYGGSVLGGCAKRTQQSASDDVAVAGDQPAACADLCEYEFVTTIGALVSLLRRHVALL
jgi:hypothetical protein